jgi:hypothetical protein
MWLTLSLLGWTMDWSIEPTATEAADDPLRDLGATGVTFVGFAQHATPEDVPLPQRTPAWDEPEE